ncbi:hypothetical protein [Anaerosalibacter massiliensis]|uniref:hypothetical protein n=1 Tax=Anaerosalibacter massiliensis TaxID=1347392 RepID=UPI00164D1FD5|nr:hypothetical protein [Anaerosalibacter massiliensis]
MKIDDFLKLMQKVKSFKQKMDRENINKQHQKIILKIYITELTDRINISMLEVI